MRVRLLILFLCLSGLLPAHGQPDSLDTSVRHSIHFGLGPVHSRLRQEEYANLLFRGTNVRGHIEYGRESGRYLFRFSLNAIAGKIKSRSGNLPSEYVMLGSAVDYSVKREQRARRTTLQMGAHLGTVNHVVANEPIFDNFSILSLHGAYFRFGMEWKLHERRRIYAGYLLPVVVYVNHVIWNGGASTLSYDDRDHLMRTLISHGRFRYLDVVHNIQAHVGYETAIGKKAALQLSYAFRYASKPDRPDAAIYSNELVAGLKVVLR